MELRPINLAAARVAERQICRRLLAMRLQVIAALVVADLLVLTAGGMWLRSLASHQHMLTNRAESTLVSTKRLQRELADLKQQQSFMLWNRKLSLSSSAWLDAINELISCLPEQSWLSRLETVPGNASIILDGGAADMSSVHTVASRIESTGAFANLKLGSTEAVAVDEQRAVRFSLSCRVLSVEPPASGAPATGTTAQSSAADASDASGPRT